MKKKLLFTAILMLFGQNTYTMLAQPLRQHHTSTDPKVQKEIIKCSKSGIVGVIGGNNWDESCIEQVKKRHPGKVRSYTTGERFADGSGGFVTG